MEHVIEFDAAYDQRDKGGGIHGVTIRFVAKEDNKAITFVIYTHWMLPGIDFPGWEPMPADLGYHSPRPMYEGQTSLEDCPYTGGVCYYDGTSLGAQEPFDILRRDGLESLWKYLDETYEDRFCRGGGVSGKVRTQRCHHKL